LIIDLREMASYPFTAKRTFYLGGGQEEIKENIKRLNEYTESGGDPREFGSQIWSEIFKGCD